jgi:hypothetical protein
MSCCGFAALTHPNRLAAADQVFSDMTELPRLLDGVDGVSPTTAQS